MVRILEKKRQFLIEQIGNATWKPSISVLKSGRKTDYCLTLVLPFLFISYLSASAMEIIDTFLSSLKGRGKVTSYNILLNFLFSLLPFWGPEPGLTLRDLHNRSNYNLLVPYFNLHLPAPPPNQGRTL